MSITHRNARILFGAIRLVAQMRTVIIDMALIDSIVMINSRTGEHQIIGLPVKVYRDRDGEWVVSEIEQPALTPIE